MNDYNIVLLLSVITSSTHFKILQIKLNDKSRYENNKNNGSLSFSCSLF
jgi:hypothetical protein